MPHDDTHTESYRLEQGKPERPDPRERLAEVPIAPSTAGVLGHVPDEKTTVDEEREAAARREAARRCAAEAGLDPDHTQP